MKRPWILLLVAFGALFVLVLGCTCVIGGVGVLTYLNTRDTAVSDQPLIGSDFNPTDTPHVIRPTPEVIPNTPETSDNPEKPIEVDAVEILNAPSDTLVTLEDTVVPINDPIELAERLENKSDLPTSLEAPVASYQIGSQESFWVTDTDTNENIQVEAALRYVTDHVYFWIEDGVSYNDGHLEALVETFESNIYPTNREFFGSEWTPGVDADPHLYILYAKGLGGSVAGYFSTADEYLPIVREYSNAHEMFLLSADHVDLNEEFAYGVLAHEFQHMIHWYRDRNEETWMNEGFSDLAMLLNEYDIGGADYYYVRNPDMQLTDWPTEPTNRSAHYGASFLFMTYFLDRFGEDATQALVAHIDNGMVSIDKVLEELNITDPQTGELIQADDVFANWIAASYLQDATVSDGRYTYHNYPAAPNPSATESIRSCPREMTTQDVSQYGADYIQITCQGEHTLHFEGSMTVGVLPVDAYSGSYAFYSNKGDESDMTLTRSFDFSEHSGPLTLSYWTWYDLEKDYDYLFLTASENGENWQILTTPSGTPEDPSGNSYGWAYNGFSGGSPEWIQESVDISQFAGKEVQLRFEYVTDAAVNGEGFLLDDIAIPEIDYFSDFEGDNGGWEADGFVRIQNVLPQNFQLTLIIIGSETTVESIEIGEDNSADIPLQIGGDVDEVILVISGTTRFTRQKAAYRFSIQP